MPRSLFVKWIGATAMSVSLAVLIGALPGCGRSAANGSAAGSAASKAEGDDDLARVQTVTVEQQDLVQKVELPGTVEGFETADLYAKVGGYLATIAVDIGDHVQKGDVLAKLWIPETQKELNQKEAMIASAQADVEQAKAAIKQAQAQENTAAAAHVEAQAGLSEKQSHLEYRQAEYNRIAGLIQSGSIPRERIDEITYQRAAAQAAIEAEQAHILTAEAEVASAKANLEKAKTDYASAVARVRLAEADSERVKTMMDYAQIRAPFNGVITKRFVDPGAFIQPADGNSAARPLVTLVRIDVIRIFLDLPMAEVRWLDRGDRAVLDRINVLPGQQFEGEVTRFATSLDRTSRMMRVEIDLENPDHRLLPGFYGYVTLYLDKFEQTPVIPSSALMTAEGESFVYVVNNGVCRKRLVTMNYQDGRIIGIGSGLTGGEQVIEAGGGQLVDGQQVIASTPAAEG